MELEAGTVVEGRVVRVVSFGAFVELEGGEQGLVHISQIAHEYVTNVRDYLNEGDIVTFDVCANDPPGPSVIDVAVDSTCPGDLDEDGFVQTADLLLFLAAFGQACSP